MRIRSTTLPTLVASLALLTGCASNPADEVPAASVGESAEEAVTLEEAPAEEPAPEEADDAMASDAVDEVDPDSPMDDPAAVTLDGEYPLYGNITVIGSKVTRSHTLIFPEWSGSLVIQDGDLSTALLGFEVDIDSMIVDPGDDYGMKPRLEEHLRSEDFFLIAEHPTARFSSTSIVEGVAEGVEGTHTITGDLTLRGVTQSISFPATVVVVDGVATASANFSVNRQDWGLAYPGSPDDLIRDEVVFEIGLTTDASLGGGEATMSEGEMDDETTGDDESTEGETESSEEDEG